MPLNRIMIIGNVGQESEMRYSSEGTAITKFTVAVNERKDSEPEWFACTLFGKRAESISHYITRGKQVYVEGRLHTNKWQDKESGEKRQRTEIIVSDVQFIDRKGSSTDDDDAWE